MDSNIKYQTKVCTIPNGTVAGIQPFRVTLDKDYDYAKAVGVYEVSAGGLTKQTLGIRMADGPTYQDRTLIADWLTSTSVPQDRRYKQFGKNIPAKGKEMIIEIETMGTASSEAEYHVVFQLVKDEPNN